MDNLHDYNLKRDSVKIKMQQNLRLKDWRLFCFVVTDWLNFGLAMDPATEAMIDIENYTDGY